MEQQQQWRKALYKNLCTGTYLWINIHILGLTVIAHQGFKEEVAPGYLWAWYWDKYVFLEPHEAQKIAA